MRTTAAALIGLMLFQSLAAQERNQTVIFVCEHGTAKSVIGSEYFKRMSSEHGKNFKVECRGIVPDSALQSATELGLKNDGFDLSAFQPMAFTAADLVAGSIVVTIGCLLPENLDTTGIRLMQWNDIPPVSVDYGAARDKIIRHVSELLHSLEP